VAPRGESIQAPSVWQAPWPSRVAGGGGRAAEVFVVIFFFVFYTNLAVVLTQFHGVPEIIASAVGLLLLVPIARSIVLERQPVVITPILPLLLAFLGALFLAGVFSTEPEVVRRSVGLYLTEGLLLYLLVSNAARTTRMLTLVAWTAIAAGSLLGSISIYQELTGTFENNYAGFAQVDRLDEGGGFNVASEDSDEKELRPRLGGPLGSENRYAQILATLFPLALIRAFGEPSRRRRFFGAVGSLLIVGGILLTFSRGAAVALSATLVFMMLVRELRIRQVLVSLAALTAVVAFVVPDYVTRLSSLEGVTALSSESTEDAPDSVIVGRQTENLAAWSTFLDHPLTGVGPGVYFNEYSREEANRLGLRYLQSQRRAHSLYLEMAADLGIIGLGAFLAMVVTAMALLYGRARYWRKRDPERAILAGSFLAALFAYLASAAFLHLSYQRFFWVLLALASAVIWALHREAEESSPGATEHGGRVTSGIPT
jgi:putative inorganic carbon (hco3(-)) transporter